MAIKRTLFCGAACLLGVALTASPAAGEATSAGVLFERAETLYRHLRSVDPECADGASWTRLLSAFGRIPVEFPADPLSGDALWRIGDINSRRLAAGDIDAVVAAQAAYDTLTKRYPSNVYAPEAYLRLGDLARPSEKSGHYFRLLEVFPGTPQAAEASRRIIGGRRPDEAETSAADNSVADVVAGTLVAREPAPLSARRPAEELEATPTPAFGPSVGTISGMAPEISVTTPEINWGETTNGSVSYDWSTRVSNPNSRSVVAKVKLDFVDSEGRTVHEDWVSGQIDPFSDAVLKQMGTIENAQLDLVAEALGTSSASWMKAVSSPAPSSTHTRATPADAVVESTAPVESFDDTASMLPPVITARVLSVRHFSDTKHTRVVFDLDKLVPHRVGEALSPPRVFIDLIGADLAQDLPRNLVVNGSGVRQIRLAVNRPGVVRAVLDLTGDGEYSLFTLAGPPRLVLDVPSPTMAERLATARRPEPPKGGSEARQLGFGVRRIVIDPGHGGTAPGAIGRSGSVEKDLTLDLSRRIASNLRNSEYEVSLTRTDDRTIDLEDRASFATDSGADLFVSIHVNSSTNRKLTGFETYYLDLATDPAAAETAARENLGARGGVGGLNEVLDEIVRNANKRESRDLAKSIQDSLVMQMSKEYGDVRDLGVKHAPFVVLVGAEMPAVLVEVAFLSNAVEEARLNEDAYRQQVADAIHIGIESFVERRRMISEAD